VVIGDGPLAQFVLGGGEVHDYRTSQHAEKALARRVSLGLFERGIFLNPMGTKLYLSLAHTEAVCDVFLERFAGTLAAVRAPAAV
jgi:glutamate-1-semialdehyde 2,1-aminomutase